MDLKERLEQAKLDQAKIAESVKELEKQIKESKYPYLCMIGQVYENHHGDRYMVCSIANDTDYNMNGLDHLSGCWNSNIQYEKLSGPKLLEAIKNKQWKYLGMFNDLYRRI